MCRMIVFGGACTRCGEDQTWDDLSQQLSCLEAKNNGFFGKCSTGVFVESHDFDQECDRCADEDEGIGDVNDEARGAERAHAHGKRIAQDGGAHRDGKRAKLQPS